MVRLGMWLLRMNWDPRGKGYNCDDINLVNEVLLLNFYMEKV